MRPPGFTGMRARSLGDSNSRFSSDYGGSPAFQRSFVQTTLPLSSGMGMSVELKSPLFWSSPAPNVRSCDRKVVLAALIHAVEATGVMKGCGNRCREEHPRSRSVSIDLVSQREIANVFA